jgi:hypothetical protein
MHAHTTSMNTFVRMSRLDLEIHESVTKNVSLSTVTSPPTERIISRKCNTHVKFRI